ncbi:MAG: phosphatase PAP2 family protein [Chitinophagaceae bacterium]|nr:MAG: phosphatase PAP2 family protein [Chitinophagaceae bacterium]
MKAMIAPVVSLTQRYKNAPASAAGSCCALNWLLMLSKNSFLLRYIRKLSLPVLIFLVLIFLVLFGFAYIAHEVLWEKEEAIDQQIFSFLATHVVSDSRTPFMESVTYFASARFLQIAYGCLFALYLLLKNFKRAFEVIAIGAGGFLVNYFMKLSFQRVRPPNPLIEPLNNFSFPSGHATSAFIFYGLLAYLLTKTRLPGWLKYAIGILLISFSLLIGFSRVYLRVHYPSDVVAGFFIGFAWLLVTIYLMERQKKKADKEEGGRGEALPQGS